MSGGLFGTVWKPAFDAPHSKSIHGVGILQSDAAPHKNRRERHTVGLHTK